MFKESYSNDKLFELRSILDQKLLLAIRIDKNSIAYNFEESDNITEEEKFKQGLIIAQIDNVLANDNLSLQVEYLRNKTFSVRTYDKKQAEEKKTAPKKARNARSRKK